MSIKTSIIPVQRDVDGMAVIGRTKHQLMGIRYGEGEGGGEGGDAAAQAAAAAQATADAEASKAPWTPENFDPARAQRLVENLRSDLDKQRTKFEADLAAATTAASEKAAKDALAGIAKLFSGEQEAETDPVKLAEKVTDLSSQIAAKDGDLTKAQADVKAANLATQVALLAHGLGGNAALLLKNEDFKTSIASVEPTDEAALSSAITKAVQATPALKATVSRSGSGEHTGATIQTLEAQLAAATEKKDFTETIRLKRAIAAARA